MENICEWNSCKEVGELRHQQKEIILKILNGLCEEHIKIFNKSWNYFDGMSQNEIENLF